MISIRVETLKEVLHIILEQASQKIIWCLAAILDYANY